MGHGPDFTDTIAGTPRVVPERVKLMAAMFLAIGVVSMGAAVATEPSRAAAAFIINFVYWAGIAQGAFMLAVASVLTKARWTRGLKRLAEGMSLFMPVLYLLAIVFLLVGGLNVYEWSHWSHDEAPPHKAIYLSKGFFIARQVVALGTLIVLNLLFLRASLRADMGVAKAQLGAKAPAFWDKFIQGWKGDDAEIAQSQATQVRLAPVIAISYALVFSMVAVDWSMSLAPHWYANMFPAWYFMSCFWSGLVYLGIFGLLFRKWLGIEHILTSKVYHDLGKLTFGLCMFWGYTLFAQYLAIWYGNMTEEIGFILLRTELEPWASVSKAVIMLCFFVPFGMLISRGLKKIPAAYLSVAGIIAAGLWLERYLVVMPSIWKGDNLPILLEIGVSLGFLGGFTMVVMGFMSKVPAVVFTDPFMQPDPDHVHVHPSHAHAHGHAH